MTGTDPITKPEKPLRRASKTPRVQMRKQPVEERIHNFSEVALGFTEKMAINEAKRCLHCKKPKCIEGCPVEIDIKTMVMLIEEREFDEAVRQLKGQNSLPGICGRVCPQEEQCEKLCILGKTREPIAIGALERFLADYELKKGVKIPKLPESTGYKIAVVGSGPAGLTAAGELVKRGHQVTIYEALHAAGGVLMYGIPEFRMPKKIVQLEVDYLKRLGVEIKLNHIIGKIITVDELLSSYDFDAVFVGTGAGLPKFLRIPGMNLLQVYSANEFLTRVNLMRAYDFPEYDTPVKIGKNTVVVGGGNVAMDSARTSLRLGSPNVTIVYRRTEAEMPARAEERENAKEEGIKFKLLEQPIAIHGNENNRVTEVECLKCQLGEPGADGRRRPEIIKGSNHTIESDVFICAIGQSPNPLIPQTTPGLKTTDWGGIITDEWSGLTSKKGVYAGGDIVTGAATVILAMGAGKSAAKAIDRYVKEK